MKDQKQDDSVGTVSSLIGGALLGGALFGPIGAIAGLFFGSQIAKRIKEIKEKRINEGKEVSDLLTPEEIQQVIKGVVEKHEKKEDTGNG